MAPKKDDGKAEVDADSAQANDTSAGEEAPPKHEPIATARPRQKGPADIAVKGEKPTIEFFDQTPSRVTGRVYIRTVSGAIDIRGDRSCTDAMSIHEFVVARKRYRELQGDVVYLPEWPPKRKRSIPLTVENFLIEVERLRTNYVRIDQNGSRTSIFDEIYGVGQDGVANLAKRMGECYELYIRHQRQHGPTERQQYPISPGLWDEMAAICDPNPVDATTAIGDLIEAPDLEAELSRAQQISEDRAQRLDMDAPSDPEEPSVEEAIEYIRTNAEYELPTATLEAAVAELAGIGWKTASLPEEAWGRIPGAEEIESRRMIEDSLVTYLDYKDPELGGTPAG